ncbi:16385_t:CDS:2, partial [Racocetra fulgida]
MSDAYLDYIKEISIEIADFNPIGPTVHIPLPKTLPKQALHPVKIYLERNPHRLYRGFVEKLNMEDIPILVSVSTQVYKKFEENNPEISLCIYEWHNQNEFLEFRYISERRRDEYKQPSPEILQQFEEAKHGLLELKEWKACIEKNYTKKKKIQKGYQETLSALNYKVKDHDYISGKYRGPAYNTCNKKLRIGSFETKVPLICYDFYRYDSHPLIKVVSKFTANKLKCIPENIGKYKAIDVGQLRFLDSFQHMVMGLDKLVECLSGKLEKFPLTIKHFIKKDIQSIAPDAEIGYMSEVDLEVLAHLHDLFADYPLVSEKQIISENWLSPYNERLVHDKEINTTIAKEIIKIRAEINNDLTAKINFRDANYAIEAQNIITIINDTYKKYNEIKHVLETYYNNFNQI